MSDIYLINLALAGTATAAAAAVLIVAAVIIVAAIAGHKATVRDRQATSPASTTTGRPVLAHAAKPAPALRG